MKLSARNVSWRAKVLGLVLGLPKHGNPLIFTNRREFFLCCKRLVKTCAEFIEAFVKACPACPRQGEPVEGLVDSIRPAKVRPIALAR